MWFEVIVTTLCSYYLGHPMLEEFIVFLIITTFPISTRDEPVKALQPLFANMTI